MSYTIYKGRLGYYVFADKVALTYNKGSWRVLDLDPTKPQWQWIASELVTNAQEITDLEFLVVTGISKDDVREKINGRLGNL